MKFGKRENRLIKNYITGYVNMTRGGLKALISFVHGAVA